MGHNRSASLTGCVGRIDVFAKKDAPGWDSWGWREHGSTHRRRSLQPDTMPAISLWEPYASLIAAGVKPYETRDYPPPLRYIGRRIALHAAKRKPRRRDFDQETVAAISEALGGAEWLNCPSKLGMVVCTAKIYGAFRVCGAPDHRGVAPFDRMHVLGSGVIPVANGTPGIQTDLFGDYRMGRWCWKLSEVRVLPVGIPTRGKQGWWTWQPPPEADST